MSFSVEAGPGGGRSLLQARGGYRERERQSRIRERAGVYRPVEFKVGPTHFNSCSMKMSDMKAADGSDKPS